MENLTDIVKKYKAEKKLNEMADSSQIYFKLKSTVQEKARYTYYKRWFPLSLWHKCKECNNCKHEECPYAKFNKGKSLDEVQTCEKCTCIKGAFNLKKENVCEYEDVENDLWLEIMRIVEHYDNERDFNTYLFACLWEWMPSFLTKDFIESISHKSMTITDADDNESELEIESPTVDSRLSIEEILSVCKTEKEKQIVIKLMSGESRQKIAKELNITRSYISLISKELQKRLKKLLDKTEK